MKNIVVFCFFYATGLLSMDEFGANINKSAVVWKEIPVLIVNSTTMGLIASIKRQSTVTDHAIDHCVWMRKSSSLAFGIKSLKKENNNYSIEIFDSCEQKMLVQKNFEYSKKQKIPCFYIMEGEKGLELQVRH